MVTPRSSTPFRIKEIPAPAFQDLHSLEWVKLYNNDLTTLHYELMEPSTRSSTSTSTVRAADTASSS
jgi:hypothetical protein